MNLSIYQKIKYQKDYQRTRKAIDNLRKELFLKGILKNSDKEREEFCKIKYNPLIEKIKDPKKRIELRKMRFDGVVSQMVYDETINYLLKINAKN